MIRGKKDEREQKKREREVFQNNISSKREVYREKNTILDLGVFLKNGSF